MSAAPADVPVAPERFPLLGHIPALLRHPMDFLREARKRGDIVKVYLGTSPAYLINSPQFIRRVLVTEAHNFDRGRLFQKARSLVGNGLVVTEGSFHRRQRRIMQPAFHRARIAGYVDVMLDQITKLSESWRPGQRMAFDKEMTELALRVTAKSLFSADVGPEPIAQVRRSLPVVVGGLLTQAVAPDVWGKVPTPSHRRFTVAQAELRGVVDRIVAKYQAEGKDHGDLLSMLIAARYEETGEPMEAEQLRDEAISIMLAGTETTGAALSWLFHELARNSDIERRVLAEIRDVTGNRPVTFEHIRALEYTGNVIKEVLRLHSPLWFILRRAVVAVDFDGTKLPAGSQVLYSPASLHRAPEFYPDPLVFDPSRWETERAVSIPRSAFIPFSSGAHQCIGDTFAITEITVAVATILPRWRLVPDPRREVREAVLATLRPSSLLMTPQPR